MATLETNGGASLSTSFSGKYRPSEETSLVTGKRILVFIDTSALKAYYDSGDGFYAEARNFMQKVSRREIPISSFVTTDYVLDEAVTIVRFAHSHEKAVEFHRLCLLHGDEKVGHDKSLRVRRTF